MASLAESDLVRNFNAMTMVRAREYERAGKVLQARLSEDGWIYGRVRGEAISPYEQVIALEKNGVGFAVSGECSCPAGFNCKHVAAVLIRLMRTGNVEIDSRRRSPLAPTNAPVERWLASVRDASAPTNDFPAGIQQRLLYVLDFDTEQDRHLPLVHVLSARLQPNGEWQRATPYKAASLGAQQYAKYLRPIDIRLLKSMQHMLRPHAHTELIYELAGPDAARILEELVETSRCHWSDISTAPLSRGPSLDAKPLWIEGPAGEQRFGLEGVESLVLPVAPPWYLDRASNKCGPIETGLDRNIAAAMLGAPKVLPEHSRRVRSELAELFGSNPELLPKAMRPPSLVTEKPEPHLHIGWASSRYAFSQFPNETVPRVPYARLEFKYGEVLTNGPGAEVRATEHGQPVVYIRDHKQEQEFWDELVQAGWVRSQMQRFWEVPPAHRSDAVMVPESGGLNACDLEQRLFQFIHRSVPKLEEKGWVLEFDDGLSGDVESRLKLSAKLSDVGSDTFDFSIEGFDSSHTYDLRPALESARGMLQRDEKERGGYVYQWLDNGKILAVEADRLLPLLAGLIGVFGDRTKWEGQLKIPGYRTVELAGLSGAFDDWRAPDKVRRLTERLASGHLFQPAKPPATFKGDLRPYQSEGVGWLDFLSEFGFGGILADDMGLGKTVQTLAHIARQKKAGLVTHPVLIVGPTSTIPNWLAEIERFTPTLKVLKLHGPHRKMDFVSIPRYDIVLTSYPLLARDRQDLIDYEFHAIVLDEAQNVKNATTNVAKASSELKANYRVALSGTPIENNLDELWSLFRFAMPGLLGGLTEFRREFRFPIENQNSNAARELLARRIRPFILRRTKEEVVKELPPKTVIVDRIEFDDAQRDLYDALLLTVEQRVREAVESRGWDKSRMEILELLLRLRQVCCDPKLLKTDEAPESAKLDRLVEMLSELASEGRRALVFSQFTSMLDLMEPRLKEQGLAWVRLSGNTKDRATPVKRFQAGEVPIFLISLRAGGTGLNLTAADTVIHYDPWWNPAVENQATDRAHRIGQDKPVFVYKLVAANTIEEKIIQLQEKKTNLAGALLAKDGDFAKSLTPEEIQWMLKG